MSAITRFLALAALAMTLASPASRAADIDRSAVDFRTPSAIRWVRNPAGTNEQAVLFGDPSKPDRIQSDSLGRR